MIVREQVTLKDALTIWLRLNYHRRGWGRTCKKKPTPVTLHTSCGLCCVSLELIVVVVDVGSVSVRAVVTGANRGVLVVLMLTPLVVGACVVHPVRQVDLQPLVMEEHHRRDSLGESATTDLKPIDIEPLIRFLLWLSAGTAGPNRRANIEKAVALTALAF